MSHKPGRRNSVIYAIRHPTEAQWLRVGAWSYGSSDDRKIHTAEWRDSIVSVARTAKGANNVIGMLPAYWQQEILRLESVVAMNERALVEHLASSQSYAPRHAELTMESIRRNELALRTLHDSLAVMPVVVEVTIETLVTERVV